MYNKTKSLEFKNFRKFADFPALEFNDITYLVGANNSGKSTFVKAVMLVFNYLQQRDLRAVDFNANGVDTLNVVSFDRVLHKSNSINNSNHIQIGLTIHDYTFDITFSRHKLNSHGKVKSLRCFSWLPYDLKLNPVDRTITLTAHDETSLLVFGNEKDDNVMREIRELEAELQSITDPFSLESIEINSTINKLKKSVGIGTSTKGWNVEFKYRNDDIIEVLTGLTSLISSMPMLREPEFYIENSIDDERETNEAPEDDLEEEILFQKWRHYDSDRENHIVMLEMDQQNIGDIQSLYNDKDSVMRFLTGIKNVVTDSEIVYLPATLNKQSALFFVRDEKNPLSQTIHSYYQNADDRDVEINNFIRHWLKEFKVGDDYKINPIEGEAYTMELSQNGIWISLADKGMGAIQATLLILRLATLIRSQKKEDDKLTIFNNSDEKNYIVVIEEPELNLHPALQSKLCDLFYAVKRDYFIEFIIETHSEYMIRRSQVITSENDFETPVSDMHFHPFSVLYFPESEADKPYAMEYRTDGKFKNEFGPGFFDESTNLAFELL